MNKTTLATVANITSAIRTIRGQKVLLDEDLARIYGVTTRLSRAPSPRRRFVQGWQRESQHRKPPRVRPSLLAGKDARGSRKSVPFLLKASHGPSTQASGLFVSFHTTWRGAIGGAERTAESPWEGQGPSGEL